MAIGPVEGCAVGSETVASETARRLDCEGTPIENQKPNPQLGKERSPSRGDLSEEPHGIFGATEESRQDWSERGAASRQSASGDRAVDTPRAAQGQWILEFHRGGRQTFEAVYRDYFALVDRAVGRVLGGADKETVIHEVFCHVMTSTEARLGFRGGSFAAWLTTLSRNRAIDFHRRRQLEQPMGADPESFGPSLSTLSFEPSAQARLVIQQFRATALPKKWARVFEARFVQQLEQHEAARELGMSRTTLAYQEYRIRKLLRRFVLGSGG